jgi:hypothetical protein
MLQGYGKLIGQNQSAIAPAIARPLASHRHPDTAGLPRATADVHRRRSQSPVPEPVPITRCLGRLATPLTGRSPRSTGCPSRVASLGGVPRQSRRAPVGDPSSHASIERERGGEGERMYHEEACRGKRRGKIEKIIENRLSIF